MAYYSVGSPAYATPWWLRQEAQEGPTPANEMPTGQLVRATGTMGTDALQRELMALQAPTGRYGGRVPPFLGGMAAGLGGIPGLGFLLGGMAQRGMQNRVYDLGTANTQRQIAQQYPSASSMPVSNPFMQAAQAVQQSQSDSDRQRDMGGRSIGSSEVGAGGWAGSGGL